MRKNVICLMVCTAVMILAASYAGISKDGTTQRTILEFVPTYAENQAEDCPTIQGAYKFAELVYEKTGGRVGIQINVGGVFGDEKTVIEQLQFGGADFARVSLSSLAESVPKLNVLQMPYLCTGQEHMWKMLKGPIDIDFMNSFGGSSLVSLSWYDAGTYNLYSTDRPTESLDGTKGLKIRVQESELMMDTIQALGVTPIPMAFGDVYSGLQTGEIDGAENNWLSYESARYYKVAQYLTLDEHTRVPKLQLAVQSTQDRLPEEYGNIIRGCAWESAPRERELWTERERTSEDRVREAGRVMTELDARGKERFREAAAPMYEEYCSEHVGIIDDIVDVGRQ